MTHPSTPLYAIAQIGADEKYTEADALLELAAHGHAISHLEIAEVQKCAAILDDFARQLYNDPAMWDDPYPAENDWMDDLSDYRREARFWMPL